MNIAGFAFNDTYSLIIVLVGLSLAPFVALMVTSYVKLIIVFNLIRNALGVQQIPPNMVLNGLGLVLTLFIMTPVAEESFVLLKQMDISKSSVEQTIDGAIKAAMPLKKFLLKHSKEVDRSFFLKSAKALWGEERGAQAHADDLMILVPSFVIGEITTAFQIGFLIFLPFLSIDLIVSNVLLAMGMMMVSPLTISLPFKLLLFVLVDGWTRLIHGLVLTYK